MSSHVDWDNEPPAERECQRCHQLFVSEAPSRWCDRCSREIELEEEEE